MWKGRGKPAISPEGRGALPPIAASGLPWLWVAVMVAVLDQLSKWVAVDALALYESVAVFPGFNWTLLHNYGAAFSFLADHAGWQRWFFVVIAFVITAVLLVWLRRLPYRDWLECLPIAMVVGGAIGNVIDRLRLGYVVDFIDVYYRDWHWPAFNLADSAICVGAVLLVLGSFRQPADS